MGTRYNARQRGDDIDLNNGMRLFIFLALLIFWVTGCDPVTSISFNINNQYQNPIQARFYGYNLPGSVKKDTIFNIRNGETKLVFFQGGGMKLMSTYFIQTNRLTICDSILITSDSLKSHRDFVNAGEWIYQNRNNSESYTLHIDSLDF